MGGSNKYDGTTARNIERTSGTDLAEKGVNGAGPDEEKDAVGEAGGIKPLHQ